MPKQRKKELIQSRYYRWKLGIRGGVYFADGRSGNRIDLGRHSLDTKDKNQALEAMKVLDGQMAVLHGMITKEEVQAHQKQDAMSLEKGCQLYLAFVARPRVTGGIKGSSKKRYRAILDKFVSFSIQKGIRNWQQVTRLHLQAYGHWLEKDGYAYRTQYLELTTLKQCLRWLINEKHLPSEYNVELPLRKAKGTDSFCWTVEQVTALVQYCNSRNDLRWLGRVFLALATTGLRISELASLRWSDLHMSESDDKKWVIVLRDESARSLPGGLRRETKSGRSRSFPIHEDLQAELKVMEQTGDGLIFHGPMGGKLKPDTLRNVMIRDVLKELEKRFPTPPAAIGFSNGRLHTFRHYFCSVCANSGVPELMVKEWLGHANSDMVRHYYHVNQREAQRQMSQLNFINKAGNTVLPVDSVSVGVDAVERTAS